MKPSHPLGLSENLAFIAASEVGFAAPDFSSRRVSRRKSSNQERCGLRGGGQGPVIAAIVKVVHPLLRAIGERGVRAYTPIWPGKPQCGVAWRMRLTLRSLWLTFSSAREGDQLVEIVKLTVILAWVSTASEPS
jgi:hypothetical protein